MQRFNPATGPKRVKSRIAAWRVFPAEFYALRHRAKRSRREFRNPNAFATPAIYAGKVRMLHCKMDQLRATNHCPIELAAECWRRELADLRARVTRPDAYKARGVEFRPLFFLWLEEQEITAANSFYCAPLLPATRDIEE